jgi:hypothetical protein
MGDGHLGEGFRYDRPILLNFRLHDAAIAKIGQEGRNNNDDDDQKRKRQNELGADIEAV